MDITKEIAEAYLKGWNDRTMYLKLESVRKSSANVVNAVWDAAKMDKLIPNASIIKKKRGWPKGKKRK